MHWKHVRVQLKLLALCSTALVVAIGAWLGASPTSAAGQTYSQLVLTSRPVAYWRLDETSGTMLADSSGAGWTGTASGGVKLGAAGALVGDPDTATSFDGLSGSVKTLSPITMSGDFTIEAWVKASSMTENAALVSLYSAQGTRTLFLSGTHFQGMTDVGKNWPAYSVVSANLDPMQWHHVAFSVRASTNLVLYVDGAVADSGTVPNRSGFSARAVLGWSEANWLGKFAGSLDEVALYSGAMSAANVNAHYLLGTTLMATPTPTPAPTVTPVAVSTPQTALANAQPAVSNTLPASSYTQPAVSFDQPATAYVAPGVSNAAPASSYISPGSNTQPSTSFSVPTVSFDQPAASNAPVTASNPQSPGSTYISPGGAGQAPTVPSAELSAFAGTAPRASSPGAPIAPGFGVAASVSSPGSPNPTTAAASPVCPGTLQSMIDAAPSGSVVEVPACVYRETIVIDKSLTLDGQGHAELRGSDVWTGWAPSGATWVSTNAVPDLGLDTTGSFTSADTFRGSHLEQVFVDNIALTQVPSNPTATQFSLDTARHVILASDPMRHLVEVSTRKAWEVTQADDVTITNFTFRHAGTAGQEHAIGNDQHANFVLSTSTVTDAHGSAIGLDGGDMHSLVLNNTLSRNGAEAITGTLDGQSVIQGNIVTDNGTGGWDPTWGAGGLRFVGSTDLMVDGNVIVHNAGPGIWCDVGCSTVVFSNNTVHENDGPGILFEVSDGATISGNSLWSNAGFGQISLSSSGNAEVTQNTLAWGPGPATGMKAGGVTVSSNNRDDLSNNQVGVINNSVHDNIFIAPQTDSNQMVWYQDTCTSESWCVLYDPGSHNVGATNAVWYPGPEDSSQRFYWNNVGYTSLAAFAATQAGSLGDSYLTDDEKTQVLAINHIPANPF